MRVEEIEGRSSLSLVVTPRTAEQAIHPHGPYEIAAPLHYMNARAASGASPSEVLLRGGLGARAHQLIVLKTGFQLHASLRMCGSCCCACCSVGWT